MERIEEEARTRGMRASRTSASTIRSDFERGYHARNTLDTIKNLAEYLSSVRGRRKALVYFSEGIDYDINDVFNNRDATTIIDATRDAIAAATRANVSIYGIDVRGLGAVARRRDRDPVASPTIRRSGSTASALQNELRLGQDSLRVLADETGGFAVVNTNDIAARSSGWSTTTARTTCSAITRPTIGATAASARSR